MDSLCILIRKPPYGTIQAAEGLRHLGGTLSTGLKVTAVLLDDGVYVAKDRQEIGDCGWTSLSDALRKTAGQSRMLREEGKTAPRLYVHGPSLAARGLVASDLVPGLVVIDDPDLASLLAEAAGVMVY